MSLYLYVPHEHLRTEMMKHAESRRTTDSGYDLLSPFIRLASDFQGRPGLGLRLPTGAHIAALDVNGKPVPYLMIARSSMSLTPLRMSNQIGLADAGYRGELIARVDYFGVDDHYFIELGRRLFQVVQHNWLPWKEIIFVDSLDQLPDAPDDRGSGGFGSTGK